MRTKLLLIAFLLLCGGWPAFAQSPVSASLTASGTTTACTTPAANAVATSIGGNIGGFGVNTSGTWSGTLTVYISGDQGSTNGPTWTAYNVTPAAGGSSTSTITGNGWWQGNPTGASQVCVVMTIYTSGTAVVTIRPSQASARSVGSSGSGGGFTAGGDLSGSSTSQQVIGTNGLTLPVSAPGLGTNSSGQIVAATSGVATGVVVASSPPYNVVTGHVSNNATFTNGSPTVTTASTDPPCIGTGTGSMVGWTIFGTKGTASGGGLISNPLTMATGTIVSCTAHSIVSTTNANANSTGTASDTLVWGPIEDTQLTAAEVAAWGTGNVPCQTLQLPAGIVIVKAAHFITTPLCTSTLNGSNTEFAVTVQGYGFHNSLLVPTPDFNFTTCGSGPCFGSVSSGTNYHDFGIWGGNYSGTGAGLGPATGIVQFNNDSVAHDLFIGGWWSATNGFVGFFANSPGQYPFVNITVEAAGGTGCEFAGAVNVYGIYCGESFYIDAFVSTVATHIFGGAFGLVNGAGGPAVQVATGARLDLHGVGIATSSAVNWALSCQGTAICNLDQFTDSGSAGSTGSIVVGSGYLSVSNSTMSPGPSGVCITSTSTATIDYLSGNTCTDTAGDRFNLAAGTVVRNANQGAVNTQTTTYAAKETDNTILCNGTFTTTLPTVDVVPGKTYTVKNIGSGTCTLSAGGTVKIDAVTSLAITQQYTAYTVVYDGTQYWLQ